MDDSSRLLDDKTDFSNLTPNLCVKNCIDKKFSYAGVQAGDECFCGDTAPRQSKIVAQADCRTKCSGDANQFCGGGWRMNVFDTRAPLFSKLENLSHNKGRVKIK